MRLETNLRGLRELAQLLQLRVVLLSSRGLTSGTDHITTSGSPETLQTEGPAEGEIAGTETVSGELNTEGRDGDAAAIGGESATNGDAGGSGGETGN